jgi:hypothetical protein
MEPNQIKVNLNYVFNIYVPIVSENSEGTTTYRILPGNLFEIGHLGD